MSILKKRHVGAKKQAGFTLAELAVVVIVIGILAAIIVPRFTGQGAVKSRAAAVVAFADSGSTIIKSTISQLQLPYAVDGSATNAANMINANRTWLDALIYGTIVPGVANTGTNAIVKTAFQTRYTQSAAGTLESSVVITTPGTGTAAGAYTLQGYPVTLTAAPATGCGTATSPRHWYFNFANMPSDVVLAIIQNQENEAIAAMPAAADTTGSVRFTAPTADGTVVTTCLERFVG